MHFKILYLAKEVSYSAYIIQVNVDEVLKKFQFKLKMINI